MSNKAKGWVILGIGVFVWIINGTLSGSQTTQDPGPFGILGNTVGTVFVIVGIVKLVRSRKDNNLTTEEKQRKEISNLVQKVVSGPKIKDEKKGEMLAIALSEKLTLEETNSLLGKVFEGDNK